MVNSPQMQIRKLLLTQEVQMYYDDIPGTRQKDIVEVPLCFSDEILNLRTNLLQRITWS